MNVRLPNKLSELLNISVLDAIACEEDPRYKLDMFLWHEPAGGDEREQCHVCMAGAVMAKSLNADYDTFLDPYDTEYASALKAINYMRIGEFLRAYAWLHGCEEDREKEKALNTASKLVRKEYNPWVARGRASWITYLKCADILEAVGL